MTVVVALSVPSPDPGSPDPVSVLISATPDRVIVASTGLPGHDHDRVVTLTRSGRYVDAAIVVGPARVDVRGRLDLATPQGWIASGVAWSVLVADAVRAAIVAVWGVDHV